MDEIIEKVRSFATNAHGDQQRKFAPEPYIAHPIRVMETCAQYSNNIEILSAALLHDVLEDTETSASQILNLLQGCMDPATATKTLEIVKELTDVFLKKDFPKWNRRKRKQKELDRLSRTSKEAQTIKYADIIDNSLTIVDAETDFSGKYLMECRAILRELNDGNNELHLRAIKVVDDCLEKLKQRN